MYIRVPTPSYAIQGHSRTRGQLRPIKCVCWRVYLEWSVDVVVGGDERLLSGLPEAFQWWRLHVDDVGSQFVGPHSMNGLKSGTLYPPFNKSDTFFVHFQVHTFYSVCLLLNLYMLLC